MRSSRNISKHEFTGLRVSIASSTDRTLAGRSGTVVDESRNMLVIESDGKEIRGAKDVVSLAFEDYGTIVEGRKIRYRPEDRIKKVR